MRCRILALVLTIFFTGAAGAQQPCAMKQRWSDDPPYSMKLADGRVVGIYVDLLREALGRMGCSTVLVEMPWARAVAELQAGRLDVLPGMLRNAERESFARFAPERWHSRNLLFAHVDAKDRWPREKLDEIRHSGFKLGAQIGVKYGPDFAALDSDPGFHRLLELGSSRMRLWQMLQKHRIDGLIADEWTARYELARLGMQDEVRATGIVLSVEAAAIAFSKASVKADFVERFNAVTEAMDREGRYRAIVRKYTQESPAGN
ncbi:MAG: transporter substrate-binding domain-containing protein [Paucibacter sp.]|nr:transporter substrate-binding domain-containing protein [Roseateles sp.]